MTERPTAGDARESRDRRVARDDERPRRAARRSSAGREPRGSPDGSEARRRPSLSAAKAAEAGLRSIIELIGKRPEGVTAVQRSEDGWLVGVEVLEDQRVPSSADVLAIYEAALDDDGNLSSYRRVRRYSRGRGDPGEDG
jgi:hypothetical protein